MRLRLILSIFFALLLALTDSFVGWIGYATSHRTLKHLTERQFALANESAANEIGSFLDDPATHLLEELTMRARRGMLTFTDDNELGLSLAERLRVNPDLAWLSYSDDKTGKFIGVWRRSDNAIILNRSTPGKGPAREQVITPDGRQIDSHVKPQGDYDPRVYPWYKNAAAATKTVWSDPYEFVEGDTGVTASRAWRTNGTEEVAGVFTVDFHLGDLEKMLDRLTAHTEGFSCILDPKGKLFCAPQSDDIHQQVGALEAWVQANPDFKNIGRETTTHLIPLVFHDKKYLAALDRIQTPSGFRCIVASMAEESVIYADVNKAATQMALVSLLGLGIAVSAGWILAHRISRPLQALGRDLARVGQFHLGKVATHRSVVQEVNQLREAADRMKSGLRSFRRYVPDEVVRQLLLSGHEAELGGNIRRLTLFFSDIEGFTTHSETVPPQILVHELSQYFEILSRVIWKHSGTIDKFIGDGLLGFFNAPPDVVRHERKACLAALEALQELAATPETVTKFRTRIGLHSGEVLVGNIGTPSRFAYTVLGDVVNVASRLEALNKIYGSQIVASQEVREPAGDDFEWRHLDRISVAGRKGQTNIFELMGRRGEVAEDLLRQRDRYEEALTDYFARDFDLACHGFRQAIERRPEDKAAQLMLARCLHMATLDLPADWDGVFSYEVK